MRCTYCLFYVQFPRIGIGGKTVRFDFVLFDGDFDLDRGVSGDFELSFGDFIGDLFDTLKTGTSPL
jgi:hypothetical protein